MSKFKLILMAARLRTLPLALSAIIVGTALAWQHFNLAIFILTALCATLLQILSNFANDYGDGLAGTDSHKRLGPTRVVASGLISAAELKKIIYICTIIIASCGLLLLYIAFWAEPKRLLLFIPLGIASILAACLYTMGKKPYGYMGLGDIMCFIFFGLVAVLASSMLYGFVPSFWEVLPASACGFLAVMVLNINNIRDLESDKLAGKKSFALLIGEPKAKCYHFLLLILANLAWILYFYHIKNLSYALFTLIIFVPLYASVFRIICTQAQYNQELQKTAFFAGLSNLLLSILLIISPKNEDLICLFF